jgi:Putative transposase
MLGAFSIFPAFITNTTSRSALMFSSGLPLTAITSADLPASSDPIFLSIRSSCEAVVVAEHTLNRRARHSPASEPAYTLHRDPVLLGRVRRCVLRTLESGLRRRCPNAPPGSRFGAVSFVQRFGSALNAHTHLHSCLTDGGLSLDAVGTLRFHPAVDLAEAAISAVQQRIRTHVLRIAVRYGGSGASRAAGRLVESLARGAE